MKEERPEEEKKSISFVEQMVEKDLADGKTLDAFRHVSRQSPMVICT